MCIESYMYIIFFALSLFLIVPFCLPAITCFCLLCQNFITMAISVVSFHFVLRGRKLHGWEKWIHFTLPSHGYKSIFRAHSHIVYIWIKRIYTKTLSICVRFDKSVYIRFTYLCIRFPFNEKLFIYNLILKEHQTSALSMRKPHYLDSELCFIK